MPYILLKELDERERRTALQSSFSFPHAAGLIFFFVERINRGLDVKNIMSSPYQRKRHNETTTSQQKSNGLSQLSSYLNNQWTKILAAVAFISVVLLGRYFLSKSNSYLSQSHTYTGVYVKSSYI